MGLEKRAVKKTKLETKGKPKSKPKYRSVIKRTKAKLSNIKKLATKEKQIYQAQKRQILTTISSLKQSELIKTYLIRTQARFLNDIDIARLVISKDGRLIALFNKSIKKNQTLGVLAVKQNADALSYLDPSLRNNITIVKAAVKKDSTTIRFASKMLRASRALCLYAIKTDSAAFEYLPKEFKLDPEILIWALKKSKNPDAAFNLQTKVVYKIPQNLLKNRQFVLKAAKHYGYILYMLDLKFKSDPQIVLASIKQDPDNMEHAHSALKKNRQFVKKALKINGACFRYIDNSLKNDKALILIAVNNNPLAYHFIPEKYKNDLRIGFIVVKKLPSIFQYLNYKLRQNNKLALLAIKRDALQIENSPFQNNPTICLVAIRKNYKAIEHIGDKLLKNKNFMKRVLGVTRTHSNTKTYQSTVFKAVVHNPDLIKSLDIKLSRDIIFILKALKKNAQIYKYLTPSQQSNLIIVVTAVRLNAKIYKSLPKAVQQIPIVIRKTLEKDGRLLQDVPQKHINKDIALIAVKQNPKAYTFIPQKLKEDSAILKLIQEDNSIVKKLPKKYLSNKKFMFAAIKSNVANISNLSNSLKNDEKYIIQIIKRNESQEAWNLIEGKFRNSKLFIIKAIKSRCDIFQYIDKKFRDDEEVVKEVLKGSALDFRYVSLRLRKKKKIVLLALKSFGLETLRYVPKKLRNDKEFIDTALKNSSANYRYVPKKFHKNLNYLIAKASSTLFGDLEDYPANIRNNKIFLKAYLQNNPSKFSEIPKRLQSDPSILKATLSYNGLMLEACSAAIKKNKKYVLMAVKTSGLALQYAHLSLLRDKEVIKAALKSHRGAIKALSKKVKKDGKSILETLPFAGEIINYAFSLEKIKKVRYIWEDSKKSTFELLPLPLRQNPNIALKALKLAPEGAQKLPEVLRSNVNFMVKSFILFYPKKIHKALDILKAISTKSPTALKAIIKRIYKINPLLLLKTSASPAFIRANFSVELTAYNKLVNKLHSLGIHKLMRFHSIKMTQEIIKNRELLTKPDQLRRAIEKRDTRPLCIFIYPKADYNGAFNINPISKLTKKYRVVYFEGKFDTDIIKFIKSSAKFKKANLVFIGGHGNKEVLQFSKSTPFDQNEKKQLKLTDLKKFIPHNLSKYVTTDARVIVDSCSTAKGGKFSLNIGFMVHQVFNGKVTVLAPLEPVSENSKFDKNGYYKNPGWGKKITIILRPTRKN